MTKAQGHGYQRIFEVEGKQIVFTQLTKVATKAEAIKLGQRIADTPHFHYRIVDVKGGGYRVYVGCDTITKTNHKKIVGHNVQRKYVPRHLWMRSDHQENARNYAESKEHTIGKFGVKKRVKRRK